MFKQTIQSDKLERISGRTVAIGSEPSGIGGYVTVNRETFLHEPTLDGCMELALQCINEWDTSENVNQFTLFGDKLWLDKATRVGLVNAVNCAKLLGKETISLGLGNKTYELPCDDALRMLALLEQYALECYNVTLHHKQEVVKITDINELLEYDYCAGYPEKLVIE